MKKDDHYLLGSLLKTSGVKGEIILKFNNDYSKGILKMESIFIDVDRKLVPFFIEEIKPKSSTTAIVRLEGLDEEAKANEFIGADFYTAHEQLKSLQINSDETLDIIGYKIIDQHKIYVGKVIDFIDIPENPLLNISTERGEFLIPAKDELIIEVDDDLREIHLHIAEGLFDLDQD